MPLLRLPLVHLVCALSLPLVLLACVTINIYFPAAAAQEAADRIIEDVWGKQPGAQQPKQQQPSAPQSAPQPADTSSYYHGVDHAAAVLYAMNLLSAPAQAAEADINIATPAIDTLRAAMKARHNALEPFYNSGAVGLTRDALIAERDASAVPLKERNALKRLVAQENQDRNALYREIAKANNHPEWEDDIRATFAKRWIDNAASGWWYQDDAGAWKQK